VGTFRVVPANHLRDDRGRAGDVRQGDLEHLRRLGLIETVAPYADTGERTTLVTLTDRGRELLESHRARGSQTYYTGPAKARELTHDSQLYRAYERAAERLEARGARVDRVVLDHELRRDYQRFLQERNRGRSDSDGRPDRTREEIKRWALEHDVPMVNERVQFPDVQIHYERADGRRDVENVEVTTVHYRGRHASGKVAAGFTRFRGRSGRVGGGRSSEGASPFDPHAAEEMLR
jgi:DNA-binding MarR family transcriptional regulator